MPHRWDIFCSVVDNFGDAGVCWRLARQLASEFGQAVRLWIDNLDPLQHLCRAVNPGQLAQRVEGVEIQRWQEPFAAVEPADIVIEGFGARLPDAYIEAMAARLPRPVWINLEYLSAEAWVEGCHGLPSPHSRLPLVKYFFFPGFTAATGGVLSERGVAQARDSFQQDATAQAAFWRALGTAPPAPGAMCVSLFCYENAALLPLAETWAGGSTPLVCVVPEGAALAQLAHFAGRHLAPGSRIQLGSLTVVASAFLELDQYDRLLWACDWNFVRGEDSFVRAQLAARPLAWQAYPQQEDAHLRKAAAFAERYGGALNPAIRAAWRAFTDGWNRQSTDIGRHWSPLVARREELAAHARAWAGRLVADGNFAARLARFCEDRLK